MVLDNITILSYNALLITDTNSLPELILDGRNGLMFHTADDLANLLIVSHCKISLCFTEKSLLSQHFKIFLPQPNFRQCVHFSMLALFDGIGALGLKIGIASYFR